MQVNDYLSAILVGLAIGVLGRLVLPGRQRIGVFVTLLVGVGAAVAGSFIAHTLNIDDTKTVHWAGLTWDWIVLAIQVGVAVIGIGLAAALTHTFLAWNDNRPQRRKSRPRKSKSRSS
jgi:uncharacterized membrane protein YeaQ/YmgE (transglycosylase-associated protein family)